MALKRAGITLVAENYQQYVSQLREIKKLHDEAFSKGSFSGYSSAVSGISVESKRLSQSTKSTWEMVQNLRSAYSDASAEATKLSSKTTELSNSSTKLGGAFSAVTSGAGSLVQTLVGLAAKFGLVFSVLGSIQKLINFGKASVEVAARNETLAVSLDTMAASAGYTQEQIDYAVEALKNQGITTSASIQSLLKMTRANISWAEATKLAAIAQSSAVVAGMNSSQAFERLITGIQKMEPELLDELGITLRRSDAYEAYAKTLGKSVKQLTDVEQKQAILNSVYEQSEDVLKVYDNAMETAGKKQGSLARKIEETQANLGKLFLPLKNISVDMQTSFWDGTQAVTLGLSSWAPIIDETFEQLGRMSGKLQDGKFSIIEYASSFIDFATIMPPAAANMLQVIDNLTGGMVRLGEQETIWERLGRGAHDWARVVLESMAIVGAGFDATVRMFRDGENFWDVLGERLPENIDKIKNRFPDLYKSFDELGEVAEVDLNKAEEATEDATAAMEAYEKAVNEAKAAIQSQIEVLNAQADALKKIEDIEKSYQKEVASAHEDYQKGMAEATANYNKEREDLIANHQKELLELEEKSARERSKMISDFNDDMAAKEREFNLQRQQARAQFDAQQKQSEKKFYADRENALKRHLLSMEQARRRQSVTERRLRADGDILGLMEARENFALEQQEAKENFGLQQDEAKSSYEQQAQEAKDNFELQEQLARESYQLQTQLQREEFAKRLQEFDENLALERQKLIESHQQELADLDLKFEEEKAKLAAQLEERLAIAEENKQAQLEQLGESLNEQGKITEEGMKEITDILDETFGEEAGRSLMTGWKNATTGVLGDAISEIKAQIAELETELGGVEESFASRANSAESYRPGGTGGRGGRGAYVNKQAQPIRMRQGGSGVVTGPARFEVEPGVKEFFQFAPISRNSNLNVNFSGSTQHKVSGMGGSNPILEKQIGDAIIEDLKIAIETVAKRGRL